ncbi:MAG: 2-succinyl-5-enolpyruvyl-6-hydroxy-3-cyclohexene-carboxylate synthase [Solirubrobacteraceae bacterium]|nr:2-succinyl-5-enolpyruvyl-6-hydroxy-3-cyclohexene-carboxylate synthase [Solirubrobacteraceae bacterium]
MPGAGDDLETTGGQPAGQAPTQIAELLVSSPDEDGDRHSELAEAVPHRLHRPAAETAQGSGQAGRGVAQLVGGGGGLHRLGLVGEQWLAAPAADELLERLALEAPGQRLVVAAALGPGEGIVDSGGGRDQHQAGDPLGVGEGQVEGDPAAERVAGENEARRRQGGQLGHAGGEVDRPPAGVGAVAREVGGERTVALPRQGGENAIEGAVRPAEPVQQQQIHAHPPILTDVATDTHVLLAAFVDELVRCGMTDACTSPGSRNTPLVLALARKPGLRAHSHVDERCAGFFALGLAKASGRPAAVTCTSGTAAANLLPAVIEAHEARVPLIVLTADRPPELRDIGAGQTIDQVKLYGDAVRWFVEVGTHEADPARVRWMRGLACRAYWTALGDRPGPVHLNWPLREPLLPAAPPPPPPPGRPQGRPWIARPTGARPPAALELPAGARGVVVAGRSDRGLAPEIPAFAARAGYPLLADPLSGARRGPAAIAHYDALLRHQAFRPQAEVVIRVGDLPTSKALRAWLADQDAARQIRVSGDGSWQDPENVVGESLPGDPRAVLAAAAPAAAPAAWLDRWREADDRAGRALEEVLGDDLSEPAVARSVGRWLGPETTLFVAASMPIRDVESFFAVRDDGPRVLSNRGANGIDGTISSAFGVAAAAAGPVVVLIGDVALAHDIGGLLAATRLDLSLTVVLLDNGGGGIFDFLRVAGERDVFERHVATPTGLDFARAAALYGLAHARVERLADLREELDRARARPGSTLIEVRTDRTENVLLHARAWDAVGRTLGG